MATAPREASGRVSVPARWWPAWPARDIWRLGLIFAGSSAVYFGSNAFLPGYLSEVGRSDLISPALSALNLGQLPASLLLIGFARQIEGRAWPFVLAGLLALLWQIFSGTGFPNQFFNDSWVVGFWRADPW